MILILDFSRKVMSKLIKREFIVLGVSSQYELTPKGHEKVYHEFKKLGSFSSLDSTIVFIFSCMDGYFRIIRKSGRRFLPSLTCRKFNNIIQF